MDAFLIKDDDLLEKFNTIKVSADIRKGFDGKPVYNENNLKTKIGSQGNEVTNSFDKVRL